MARLSSDGPGRTGGESTWIAPYSPLLSTTYSTTPKVTPDRTVISHLWRRLQPVAPVKKNRVEIQPNNVSSTTGHSAVESD